MSKLLDALDAALDAFQATDPTTDETEPPGLDPQTSSTVPLGATVTPAVAPLNPPENCLFSTGATRATSNHKIQKPEAHASNKTDVSLHRKTGDARSCPFKVAPVAPVDKPQKSACFTGATAGATGGSSGTMADSCQIETPQPSMETFHGTVLEPPEPLCDGCEAIELDPANDLPTELKTAFDERAAIAEFDGGLDRNTAERLARDEMTGLVISDQNHQGSDAQPPAISNTRAVSGRELLNVLPAEIQAFCDTRNKCDGLLLLKRLPSNAIPVAFFDPQYRGILDKLKYGNEGTRQKARAALAQMSSETIREFIQELARVITPSGHIFLWVDKFHLVEGINPWVVDFPLSPVDAITWDKIRIGMGYRTRRRSEYLVVLQKEPKRAKGVWTAHDIPDVWAEKVEKKHPHAKPEHLQAALIVATTAPGDIVLDPAAGGFSVMRSAHSAGRRFLGCDLEG
jgi:site-specific DNA-methyltransferase (adenine-specific)